MSAVVHTAIVSDWTARPAFQSVGLVCTCGRAVATFEGYARACEGCGAVYLVTVTVLRSGKADARDDAATEPAVADGPVSDTAETLTAEAGRPIPEPDGDDSDTVTHG